MGYVKRLEGKNWWINFANFATDEDIAKNERQNCMGEGYLNGFEIFFDFFIEDKAVSGLTLYTTDVRLNQIHFYIAAYLITPDSIVKAINKFTDPDSENFGLFDFIDYYINNYSDGFTPKINASIHAIDLILTKELVGKGTEENIAMAVDKFYTAED